MQHPTRTSLSFSSIAPRRNAKYATYDNMTTGKKNNCKTSMCAARKNATIYGPTIGYAKGLINAAPKEYKIIPGASLLPMTTSPINVVTIRVTAWIASDFSR